MLMTIMMALQGIIVIVVALACADGRKQIVTPATMKKMRKLADGLTAEDLRALAIECKMPEATYRQLPGLVDALIADYHDALLDRLELRINEVAKEIAS